MTDRETILRIIGAIGGDPGFGGNAETCQLALEKAASVLREHVAEAKQFTHQWYAVRWERLRQLIKDEAPGIEDKACCVMANATAYHMEPPTYDQILAQKNCEIKAMESAIQQERDLLVALIEDLWQHAEPSLRDPNIRDQVACVLSTAGNALGSEKPT